MLRKFKLRLLIPILVACAALVFLCACLFSSSAVTGIQQHQLRIRDGLVDPPSCPAVCIRAKSGSSSHQICCPKADAGSLR